MSSYKYVESVIRGAVCCPRHT